LFTIDIGEFIVCVYLEPTHNFLYHVRSRGGDDIPAFILSTVNTKILSSPNDNDMFVWLLD
jgi:hypothetical protein